MTDIEPSTPKTAEAPEAAAGKKVRRQLPDSTRRILLIILSLVVLAASVAGFYLVSDAFDERTPVLVTAVDIQQGETLTAGYFTSKLAVMGSIPHIPYTPNAPRPPSAAPLAFGLSWAT